MGFVIGIERELDDRVIITEECFDEAMRSARSQSSDLRGRHVVRAMALAATDHLRSPPPDREQPRSN
jgi:hypothetical protein